MLTKQVKYTYDVHDRLIRKQVDDDGDGLIDRGQSFVYDGGDVVLIFDNTGAWQHRYLHGDVVDQVFMQENIGEILWGLADNQGTIRDVANYDPLTDTSAVLNHRQFDAFGGITSETNAAINFRQSYTGGYFDEDSGLLYRWHRWYDAKTARWMSEDWILDDTNSYRYVRNSATNLTDPSGLAPPESEAGFWRKVHDNVRLFAWALSTQKDRIPRGVGPYISPKNIAIDTVRDTIVGVSATKLHIAQSCEKGLLDPQDFVDRQKAFALGATSSFPTIRTAGSASDVLSPGSSLYGGSSVALDWVKEAGTQINSEAAQLGSEAAPVIEQFLYFSATTSWGVVKFVPKTRIVNAGWRRVGRPSSPNRGVIDVLETPSNARWQFYQDGVIGARSDILTRKRIVPGLRFDNPNPGKNLVKFDGRNGCELIDRKLNVTTRSHQIYSLQSMSRALKQNPSFSGVIEVPTEAARRAALRALKKAKVENITVRVAN